METGMIDVLTPQFRAEIIDQIPLKQLGPVSNIVEAMLYIISEDSGYLTGQDIALNGGMT